VTLSALLLPPLLFALSAILLAAAFIYVAWIRSDGEWRYRNGK